MSVNDHGLDAIRKSTVPYPNPADPSNRSEFQIRTTGTSRFAGLSESMRTTTMDVTDIAVKMPTTPLTNRNSLEVHNLDDTYTLFVGTDSSVTADRVDGVTSGKEIPPLSFWNLDITNDIELWGIVETGQTIKIKITEVA